MMKWIENETMIIDNDSMEEFPKLIIEARENAKPPSEYIYPLLKKEGITFISPPSEPKGIIELAKIPEYIQIQGNPIEGLNANLTVFIKEGYISSTQPIFVESDNNKHVASSNVTLKILPEFSKNPIELTCTQQDVNGDCCYPNCDCMVIEPLKPKEEIKAEKKKEDHLDKERRDMLNKMNNDVYLALKSERKKLK